MSDVALRLHYTRASRRGSTTMRSRDGGAIEVIEVGSFESGALEFQGSALTDWLGARARDRCIEIHAASPLQRIVFEDGEVVGAVVATPDGPYAVRARHGVAVAPGGPLVSTVTRHELLAGHATARLCLVSRTASRFGRLELLTTEPLAQRPASTCRPTNRRLHASLHETRQLHVTAFALRKSARVSAAWPVGTPSRRRQLGVTARIPARGNTRGVAT